MSNKLPDKNLCESGNPELLESRLRRDWIPGRTSLARNDDFSLSRELCKTLSSQFIFWVISQLVDLIFFEGLTRARKKRQIAPQASAGYPLSINPCLPSARRSRGGKRKVQRMREHPCHS
jgi:hypothetical protein